MNPEHSLQDVVRCHLCETQDAALHCDVCQKYLCQDCKGKHLSNNSSEHRVKLFKINSLDPEYSLQDVVRCHLCESPVPPLHCVICNIHLCKDCEGKHLSDESKLHKVVPFKYRGSFPYCHNHSTTVCDQYCEQCNIPVCVLCVSSNEHRTHNILDILKSLESNACVLQIDLQDLIKSIYPKYHEIANSISGQKAYLKENFKKLTTAIDKHGEDLHREIDIIIKKLKTDLDEMESKHLVVLNKQLDEITGTISDITKSIAKLNKLMDSNDVSLVSAYKSRNAEFRRLPPKFAVSLPSFTSKKINNKKLCKHFGFLSVSSITAQEHGYSMDFPSDRPLIDVPRIITEINTPYVGIPFFNGIRNVSCVIDHDQIWMCGFHDSKISLFDLQGKVLKSIKTKYEQWPWDIAVTRSGDLVYTELMGGTLNIVNNANTEIKTVDTQSNWYYCSVCSTYSGDLLVVMQLLDDVKETKVVRYSGSTEKQSIQFDDKGNPIYSYSSFSYYKCISENRNLDICVSDDAARAIVVVNQAGKLRFTYTGPSSTTKGSFNPRSITTDSQGRILTADISLNKYRIHILDQDGQFLRYIDNCHLHAPWSLCLDIRDNLFVAECDTGKVKKIQYYV